MDWMVTKSKLLGAALSAGGLFLLGSCTHFEESGLPGSASSMARNQMMWVRKTPPTFGYYRFESLSRVYPDLGLFTESKGLPDFLAETANRGRSYFILYYLDRRQAFACRNRPGQRKAIEFAGPYPITDKEYRTLDQLRRKGGQ
jgi:hypothetical protein